MVPPSQGWLDVRRESMGCWGSVVGSRADMVKERAVGDRTKSCMYRQYGTLVYI